MPKSEEKKIKKSARKAGLKGKDADAYLWGTMNKIKKARAAKRKKK